MYLHFRAHLLRSIPASARVWNERRSWEAILSNLYGNMHEKTPPVDVSVSSWWRETRKCRRRTQNLLVLPNRLKDLLMSGTSTRLRTLKPVMLLACD